MSDAESEDGIELYSALERNQRQPKRMFVTLDSDDSDDGSDDAWARPSPKRKRKRKATPSPPPNGKKTAAKSKKKAKQVQASDDEADDGSDGSDWTPKESLYEDLLTPEELAAERERKAQVELEISLRLAKDTTLAQTRAVMNKVSTFQAANAIELLDSDDDDDDAVEIVRPKQKRGAVDLTDTVKPPPPPSAPTQAPTGRGERIKLQVRSNGAAIDEVSIHMNDPFDLLYVSFCDIHGLPRTAVKMVLDGEELSLTDTPAANDLETGDLIDAKVDFSQRVQDNIKRYLRLRLVVFGKRAEVFKIDARSKVEKLHNYFCTKHSIGNPDDVTMSVNGQALDLDEVIEFYGLIDGEEVSVVINNFVDPAAIPLQLRYEDGSCNVERVLLTDKVQVLLQKIADLKQCAASAVTLRIDGERMAPTVALGSYDLEGDELIDVKLDQ